MNLQLLEELYTYLNGNTDAISLGTLIKLINAGYLLLDFSKKINVNIKLNNGIVIRDITIPLDLSSEEGRNDAYRVIRVMMSHLNSLSPVEKRIFCMLARRLGVPIPRLKKNSDNYSDPAVKNSLPHTSLNSDNFSNKEPSIYIDLV